MEIMENGNNLLALNSDFIDKMKAHILLYELSSYQ